jgi:glycosyltransferase involved in cell wall biosynthesis
VVLEAAAAGVPCVTTPATGTVDAVVHGRTGLVAADHEPKSFSSSLACVLTDAELRRRLGDAARERVVEEFDQEVVWQRYADLYADLLSRLRAGRSV